MDDAAALTASEPGFADPGVTDPASGPDPVSGRHAPAPDAVWAVVRETYLSGLTARETCRRHGVGLSALRDRAAREGWRRADQPWTPPNRLDPDDEGVVLEEQISGDLDKVELCQLTFIAYRRMLRAVMRGDAVEALRWRRVRLALDEEEAEMERMMAQAESLRTFLQTSADPDSPDSPDSIFPPTG